MGCASCSCVLLLQMPGRFIEHGDDVRPLELPPYAFELDEAVLVCAVIWEEQAAWLSVARRDKSAGEIRVKSYSSAFKVLEPDGWKQRRCEVAEALGTWVKLQLEMAGAQKGILHVVCEDACHAELLPYFSGAREDGRACTIAYALRSGGVMQEEAFTRMRDCCEVIEWRNLLTGLLVAAS